LSADINDFYYLSLSNTNSIDKVDDKVGFKEVCDAMKTIGIAPDIQFGFFESIAAVLLLGNVKFAKEDDKCKIANMDGIHAYHLTLSR